MAFSSPESDQPQNSQPAGSSQAQPYVQPYPGTQYNFQQQQLQQQQQMQEQLAQQQMQQMQLLQMQQMQMGGSGEAVGSLAVTSQSSPAFAAPPAPYASSTSSPQLAYPLSQVNGSAPIVVGSPPSNFASAQYGGAQVPPHYQTTNAPAGPIAAGGAAAQPMLMGTMTGSMLQQQQQATTAAPLAPRVQAPVMNGHIFAMSMYEDKLRISRAPAREIADVVRKVILTYWERGIQQEFKVDNNPNDIIFKFKGRPWKKAAEIDSNRVLLKIIHQLYLSGWRMIQPCQDPTKSTPYDMLLFVPLEGVPYPYVSFTLMMVSGYNTLRLLDCPFDPRALLSEAVKRNWTQGLNSAIVLDADKATNQPSPVATFDIKLKGSPFGYGTEETIFLVCDVLQQLQMNGWNQYSYFQGLNNTWILYKQQ